jgi:hypothetical protein
MKRIRISKISRAAIRHGAGDKEIFISVHGTYQTISNLTIQPAYSTQPSKSEASKVAVMLKCAQAMKGSNTEI